MELDAWARQLPRDDYFRLKQAWRELVRVCGGPARVAQLTRARNPSLVSEYGRPQCLDRFPPLDVIADLEAECGEPIVTRVLADMLGCDLAPREASPVTRAPEELLGDAIQQAADVPTTFLKSGKGGWDRTKKDLLRVQIAEAQDALERLDEWAAADVEPTLRAVG